MVSLKSLLTPRRAQTNARPPQSTPAAPLAYLFDNGQLTPIKSGYFESGGADSSFGAWSRGGGYHELYQGDQGYAQAYATCEWVFRAVNVKTQKISDVLRQGKVIGTDGQPIANHPLMQAINEGYRRYQRSVFKQWPYNKSIFGETYVHIEKAAFGLIQIPRAVRVLNSLYTEPVIFNNEISHFTYEGGGTSQIIPWADMVYDINIDPRDDTRGLSDVAVALDSVNIDRSLIIVTKNWLRNNARPGIIFTPKTQTLSPGDIDLLKTKIAEQVKGPGNAGKPLILTTPLDVTTAAPPSLEDQQYLTDDKKRRICTAIGVPTALVDYTDMAFQLSEEQARNFYDLTVIPGAQDIVDLINVSLMPMFDRSGAVFTIPVEDILSRLQDPNTARQAASAALQGGALTLNETRKKHGVEPVTGGDVFFFPTGIVPVPANQIANAGALIQAAKPPPMLPPGNSPQPSAPPPALPVRSVTFDPTPVQPVQGKQAAPEDELRAWRRKVKQGGVGKSFVCYSIPKHVEAFVRDELAAGAEYGGVFDDAAALLNTANLKAYEDTTSAFYDEVLAEIGAAQADETSRAKFAGSLRSSLRRYGLTALRDGMNEVGYDPESLNADELAAFRTWQDDQSGFVSNFGAEIFKEGITEDEVKSRAQMWTNSSLSSIRYEGMVLGAPNKPYRWKIGKTEQHCGDCLANDGQVKPLKDWKATGKMPKSFALECHGVWCDCGLEEA